MLVPTYIQKLVANFYFNPKIRKIDQASKFLHLLKNCPQKTAPYQFLTQKFAQIKTLQSQIVNLCDAMADIFIDYKTDLNDILSSPKVSSTDTIHNKNVKLLIEYGIIEMRSSKDPFHDFSHIYRCIKLAKIYFLTYHKKYNLDWGTIVTAIVFHDISRVNYLSFLYSSKYLKPLEFIPFVLDFSIMSNVYNDAEKSADLFISKTKKLNLPENFVSNVIYGILGTSPSASDLKLDSIYFKIVSDVDKLDMFSIARFESALRNVLSNNMANMRYFNRSNLLASFVLKKSRQNLHLNISAPIFDSFVESLKYHGTKFYPLDAKILS